MNFVFSWPAGERQIISQTLRMHVGAIRDFRPVWPRFASNLRTQHRLTFVAMTDPFTGESWTPLTDDYAATKPAGTRNRILYRTGRLQRSLTTGAKSSDSVFVSEPLHMEFGTRVPYAIFHQVTERNRKDGAPLKRRCVGMRLPVSLVILARLVKTHIIATVARARRGSVYA